MSCEQGPNKIAKWAGRISSGISQLAGKRGFYAGLALGSAGLMGAGLVAAARRRSRGNRSRQVQSARPAPQVSDVRAAPVLAPTRRVPQLGPREKVRPMASGLTGDRCAGCQTPAGSKPGAWYSIHGRTYCPDCAPAAANKADIDLVAPAAPVLAESFAGAARSQSAAQVPVTPCATRSQSLYLPAERRAPTQLIPSRVGVYAGQNEQDQPVWFAVNNSYVVVRPDGRDTGLALTPALKMNDQGDVAEDTGRWWVTHIPSGKHIPEAGPYERPEEGELLASVLAQLDWTRDETELSTAEIRRVGATVTAYNTALAEQKQKQVGATPASPSDGERTSRRPPATESLVGTLVADGYGGVARVLDATRSGQRLYVIDSLGERYEVDRRQVRTPDQADFEGVRVAMAFDPAKDGAAQCALCGRPASGPGAGEKWYRMNFKTFCTGCADRYAAQEGYAKEDEIGDLVELAGPQDY